MDRYPYTNFHELNLTYFLKHFTEIFQQWDSLYQEMQTWKDATEEELETWKNGVIADIEAWETTLLGEVGDWEDALMASLEAWKTAFETLFNSTFSDLEDIKTDAEAARDAAIAAQEAAEAAAATFTTDPTLSISGKAADAKATGDAIADTNSDVDKIESEFFSLKAYDFTPLIPDNTDLNTLLTAGNYKVTTAEHASTMINGPAQAAGYRLQVMQSTLSNRLYQIAILNVSSDEQIKLRFYNGTWSSWRTLTTSGYVQNQLALLIDPTLSIEDKAADAKAVGDAIEQVESELADKAPRRLNVWSLTEMYGIHTDSLEGTYYTYVWDEIGSICTINSKTSEQPSAFKNVFAQSASTAAGFQGGKKYYFICEPSDPALLGAKIFWYRQGGRDQQPSYTLTSSMEIDVPADVIGVLYRIEVFGGAPYVNETIHIEILNRPDTSGGEVINNTFESTTVEQTVTLTSEPTITTDTNNYLAASGDNTDRASDILTMLSATGVCHLGPGDFYCSGVVMPQYSSIIGSGPATRLILTANATDPLITMKTRCHVSDLTMMGNTSSIEPSEIGSRDGILWQGTFTDKEHSYTAPYRGIVSNVFFYYFAGSAIKLNNTGDQTYRCLTVSDSFISSCGCGINIERVSEYNRFDSCSIYGCWIGVINNGGNNVFTGCSISGNKAGFVIDNSDGAAYNNAHGSCIGCLFNHNGYGNSSSEIRDAVRIIRSANGFTFTGCSIFFGHINIDRSNGIIFDSCLMRGDDITVNAGGTVLFSDNIFTYQPTVTKTGATHVIAHDNYIKATGAGVTF